MDEKEKNNVIFDGEPEEVKADAKEDSKVEGFGFTMTPSEPTEEKSEAKSETKTEGFGFTMTPSEPKAEEKPAASFEPSSEAKSEAKTEGFGFTMTPSEPKEEEKPEASFEPSPEAKSEAKTEGFGFTMTPSEPKAEEKPETPDLDMNAGPKRPEPSELAPEFKPTAAAAASASPAEPQTTRPAASTSEAQATRPTASPYGAQTTRPTASPSGAQTVRPTASTSGAQAQPSAAAGSRSSAQDAAYVPAHQPRVHAAPKAKKKKEKKYVTRGALIACMIATMLISSLLGAVAGGFLSGGSIAESRKSRDDSALSQLNLSDATGSELTVSEIVDMNADAVVEIVVSGTAQGLWGQLQPVEGAGSGVIVKENGYIATNYHVIQGANKIQVTLHNGDTYNASIVGEDAENDVAVIKIDAKDLKVAAIGDSSKVNVGDLAVAIGNPLGQLGGTATTGIISALDRTLNIEGTTLTLLQTDAAINGGNSGGGLFNSKGELIGIVESKASAVGVEGLAFALPINTVSEIINDMIENGGKGRTAKVQPAIGIVISDVSDENAQYNGLESAGVYIVKVTGENAQKAGFQEKDKIISIDGKKVGSGSEFISLVRKHKVGDTVSVVISRGGQEMEIKTVLEELQTN